MSSETSLLAAGDSRIAARRVSPNLNVSVLSLTSRGA